MPKHEPPLRLDLGVLSLEGRELLPAGTVLDDDVLAAVSADGQSLSWSSASFLGHGTVRRDIAHGTRQGHYATVFWADDRYDNLERIMGAVRLPEPCLRGLDWFCQHDYDTYRHILMVFALACLLAERLGHNGREAAAEVIAGPLHDFGKLCVPLEILRKQTPLAHAERALLEQHTLAGHVLLAYYLGGPGHFATRVARDHHERRDGSGYPRGCAVDDPVVEIVAVCDIYDALVSPRPYRRQSYDTRTALEEITRLAETGTVGWEIVKLLVAQHRSGRPSPEKVEIPAQKRGTPPPNNLYGTYSD